MNAATGLKRLGILVAGVIAAGIAVLWAGSLLISADSARDAVKAQIRAVTGLDPVLRGPVEVSLFPSGTVSLGDVVLGEDKGHAPPLVAERLVAHLRFLPLLIGRIEIADITLDRPNIAVKIDADGQSNWSPLLASLARALTPVDRTAPFSEIRINGGTITVRDAGHNLVESLTQVDLSLAWPSISQELRRHRPLLLARRIGRRQRHDRRFPGGAHRRHLGSQVSSERGAAAGSRSKA